MTLSFDQIAEAILAQEYIFAKTMPDNPHWYCLRKKWRGEYDFEEVVQSIRDIGYKRKWGKTTYVYLNINGHKYWTMGAKLASTILINKAVVEEPVPYDNIAERYDDFFAAVRFQQEDEALIRLIGMRANDRVLDIGCGTGTLLSQGKPSRYVGIDPSSKMLDILAARHGVTEGMEVIHTPLENYYPEGKKFSLITALYGSASYCTPEALKRIPDMLIPGGRYFLMTYAPFYQPVTYAATGLADPPVHFDISPDILPGAAVATFGNYTVIRGGNGREVLPREMRAKALT